MILILGMSLLYFGFTAKSENHNLNTLFPKPLEHLIIHAVQSENCRRQHIGTNDFFHRYISRESIVKMLSFVIFSNFCSFFVWSILHLLFCVLHKIYFTETKRKLPSVIICNFQADLLELSKLFFWYICIFRWLYLAMERLFESSLYTK